MDATRRFKMRSLMEAALWASIALAVFPILVEWLPRRLPHQVLKYAAIGMTLAAFYQAIATLRHGSIVFRLRYGILSRFRFGLRTLFVVVTVVAFGSSWFAYSMNWIRERREFLSQPNVYHYGPVASKYEPPKQLPWSLRMFGENGVGTIRCPSFLYDDATRLFPEARLHDPELE